MENTLRSRLDEAIHVLAKKCVGEWRLIIRNQLSVGPLSYCRCVSANMFDNAANILMLLENEKKNKKEEGGGGDAKGDDSATSRPGIIGEGDAMSIVIDDAMREQIRFLVLQALLNNTVTLQSLEEDQCSSSSSSSSSFASSSSSADIRRSSEKDDVRTQIDKDRALLLCCTLRSPSFVELLLSHGANPGAGTGADASHEGYYRQSPLIQVLSHHDRKMPRETEAIVAMLLKAGEEQGDGEGQGGEVEGRKPEIHRRTTVNYYNESPSVSTFAPPPHNRNRCNVNERDLFGKAPLHYAVAGFHAGVVSLLLAHGADPLIRQRRKNPSLVLGETRDDGGRGGGLSPIETIAQTFVSVLADPQGSLRRRYRQTCQSLLLHPSVGVDARHVQKIRRRCASSGDGDDNDNSGDANEKAMMAEVSTKRSQFRVGNTPLAIATQRCNNAALRILIEFGADVNAANEVGVTLSDLDNYDSDQDNVDAFTSGTCSASAQTKTAKNSSVSVFEQLLVASMVRDGAFFDGAKAAIEALADGGYCMLAAPPSAFASDSFASSNCDLGAFSENFNEKRMPSSDLIARSRDPSYAKHFAYLRGLGVIDF